MLIIGDYLRKTRQNMIDFCGLLELELDFSGEDVAFADRTAFLAEINNIYQTIEPLVESFAWGNALKKGIAVAIIGKPNSGKSTLLNALLQEEKAIVSPIAGTTRDSIEDVWIIEGIPFRLIDTAGLRKTQDEIENLGIEKSYQKAESASVLVYLADAQENPVTINTELLALQEKTKTKKENTILVYNKIDLFPEAQTQESPLALHTLHISAKMGKNTHSLKDALFNWAKTQTKHTGALSNVRHYNALTNTLKYLKEVEKGLKNQVSADWLALDLRMALHEISEITGAVSSEDILDSIFSKFCIGK
jgi:tRNA modification GTPase